MQESRLTQFIPGLRWISSYNRSWLRYDIMAGLSVAAVALPTGIAYAPLVGLPPIYGLYASILPLVAYALFGSSRQLIIGPDAATAALAGAALISIAGTNTSDYVALSAALAILTGLFCIAAGIARLGFIANFLAKPILVGFMNGVALVIIVGQLGKLFGFSLVSGGIFRQLYDFFSKVDQTKWLTFLVGVIAFVLLIVLKKIAPRVPAPLVVVVFGIIAVVLFGLDSRGVATVGTVPSGLPEFGIPKVGFENLGAIVMSALGIMIVSYSSSMVTARSFAVRNKYEIDANQEFIGLGAANIASGFSQGFAISGTDSRTAISDSAGGKTHMTGIVAAVVMLVVLLFFTSPLAYLPVAVIGAVLISAAVGLFNFPYIRGLYKISKPEFYISVAATLGVVTVGVLPGILIAVGLSILKMLGLASHPHEAILGKMQGIEGYFDVTEYPESKTVPGMLIYRFDSALVFFNADYFRNRVRALVKSAPEKVEWVVIDADPINVIDTTATDMLEDLRNELSESGTKLAIARAKGLFLNILNRTGFADRIGRENIYPTVRAAINAFENRADAPKS